MRTMKEIKTTCLLQYSSVKIDENTVKHPLYIFWKVRLRRSAKRKAWEWKKGSRRDIVQDKSGLLIWFWLDRRVTAQWTGAELGGYCGLALQIFRTSSQKEFVSKSGKLSGEDVRGGKNRLHYIFTLRGWSSCWEINGTHYQGWNIKDEPNSFSHWNKAFNIWNVNPTTSLTENVTLWSVLDSLPFLKGEFSVRRAIKMLPH